jgi:hypothetical protein
MAYLARILGNAAISGGLVGGAHALISKGVDNTVGNMVDPAKALTGGPDDQGPVASFARNVAFSPLTAAAAGAYGLHKTKDMGLIGSGANSPKAKSALKQLATALNIDADELATNATPKEVSEATQATSAKGKTSLSKLESLRRTAGVPSEFINPNENGAGKLLQKVIPKHAETIKGSLSELGRRHLSTFGQSWPRRGGRAALMMSAAAIPGLLGATLTSDPKSAD